MISKMPMSNMPSERSFGLLFTLVFILGGIYTVYKSLPPASTFILFLMAILFLAASLLKPRLLTQLNKSWFLLGFLMGKLVTPIVLGIIFFLLITPIAVITRVFGRDELKLYKKITKSHWVDRNPAGPEPMSFKNQF